MKKLLLLVVSLCSAACFGQDWKPCQDVQATMKAKVDRFNSGRKDGLVMELACMYTGDPSYKRKPKERVDLTAEEIITLNSLRRASHRAFEAQDSYEKYLFAAHHVRTPEPGDRCFNFVGFVLDEDFITVDPNPMMADSRCK